jgi:hypothetical protein
VKTLLAAIVEDNRTAVQELRQADSGLAMRLIGRPKLYDSKIFHWIYAGDTALHLAAAGYRVEIVRILLAAGADPNTAKNHRGSSPLHYAADGFINGPAWDAKRQVETIQHLVGNGADIHLQDKNGATPLPRAVRTRCAAAVRCLLQAGADPTARNKPGSTAFHLAVQNTGRGGSGAVAAVSAQREIIKEFLSFGLSPSLKCGKGKSVRDSARSAWIRELLAGSTAEGAAARVRPAPGPHWHHTGASQKSNWSILPLLKIKGLPRTMLSPWIWNSPSEPALKVLSPGLRVPVTAATAPMPASVRASSRKSAVTRPTCSA